MTSTKRTRDLAGSQAGVSLEDGGDIVLHDATRHAEWRGRRLTEQSRPGTQEAIALEYERPDPREMCLDPLYPGLDLGDRG